MFEIGQASAHRDLDGRTVWFCCEKCAMYFAEHAAQVAAARNLSPPR